MNGKDKENRTFLEFRDSEEPKVVLEQNNEGPPRLGKVRFFFQLGGWRHKYYFWYPKWTHQL